MSSIEGGIGVDILFGFAVSGTTLVVCCCDNNLAPEYGIQPLVLSGKGCIVDPQLFESEQSTHDVFCHFPQWNYDCKEALHHQTDCHPSFLCLSLVLGYLRVVGSNHWDVLFLLLGVVIFISMDI